MTLGRPGALLAGRYRLDRLLGGAGSAERWQAYDERLARPVTARLTPATEDAAHGEAAEAALAAMARLNHPGVAAVYDVGTADDLAGGAASYAISEWTDGRTLEQIMLGGPQPWPRTADWGRQIGGALAALHAVGLAHGALDPNNIAIHDDRRVKILDAGLTGTSGAAEDIHALGLLLWRATTGEIADFVTAQDGARELDLQPLQDARVPPEMADLLAEMLDADPAARPTAAVVEQRFTPFAASERTTGTLPAVQPAASGLQQRVGPSTRTNTNTTAALAVAESERRRRRGLVIGLALLLAAIGAGIGLLLANLGPSNSANPGPGQTAVPSSSPGTVTLPSASPSPSSSPSQAPTSAPPSPSASRSGSPSPSASPSRSPSHSPSATATSPTATPSAPASGGTSTPQAGGTDTATATRTPAAGGLG